MIRRFAMTALAAMIITIGGNGISSLQGQGQPMMAASAQQAGAADAGAEAPAEVIEMAMGAEDAPITVIEYASFTCPHCARFHEEVYPDLIANYVDTGHVRFILREIYFDRYGLWAGLVARCGGPEQYFGISALLMESQRDWVTGDPGEVAANLRRVGLSVGMSEDQLDVCLTDSEHAEAMITLSTAEAEADQVTGTPSFVINGELYSNMNYPDFAAVLDGLLENAN
jgi:protein-disulfide isomerase